MKKMFLIFIAVLLSFSVIAFAGQNQWYVKIAPSTSSRGPYYSQAYVPGTQDYNTGVTMTKGQSGVSLIWVIDQLQDTPEGVYSLQPGVWRFAYAAGSTGDAGVSNQQTTGNSADSSVTIEYRYGLSNKILTATQWEAFGMTGTTRIGLWTQAGVSTFPIEFFPEPSAYIGIFAGSESVSSFCTPRETYIVYQ